MLRRILLASIGLAALTAPAWAILRVNGNQLLSGSDSYTSSTAAKVFSPSRGAYVAAPTRLIFALGQGVMGRGQLDEVGGSASPVAVVIGLGLGYDIANVAYNAYNPCPVTLTGDVNDDGRMSAQDIIYLIGYGLKGASAPEPCVGAGDVNCSGDITMSDIVYLVNYVFKGGEAPCDVCALPSGTWTCP